MAGLSVGIVGAGGVGIACAWSVLLQGLAGRVTIYDRTPDKAAGEAADFAHGMPLLPRCEVRGRGIDAIEAEDVLVITVGAHVKPGKTRLHVQDENIEVMETVAGAVEAGGMPRVALVVSNPVDVLTEYLTRRWGGRDVSVFGSGTSLDTLRLTEQIATYCGVHQRAVHASIVGEHGDSSVFLFGGASIGSVPLAEFADQRGLDCGPEWRRQIEHDVRTAAYDLRALKGTVTHGIGLAVSGLVRCIARERDFVLPVSVRVDDGVCASLPCPIGPDGAGSPLMPLMTADEQAGWQHTLTVLRSANERLPIAAPG
jgi:L-lactate dehydrogenase